MTDEQVQAALAWPHVSALEVQRLPVIAKLRNAGASYRAIGKVIGVTPERIRQIINRAERLSRRKPRAPMTADWSPTGGPLLSDLELSARAHNAMQNYVHSRQAGPYAAVRFGAFLALIQEDCGGEHKRAWGLLMAIPNVGRQTACEIMEIVAHAGGCA